MTHIFIVNPYAGRRTFADDLRIKLSQIEGLNYFVFNTRYAGYETEIVREIHKIFDNEKLRFYCCGGSGTMRNILNGFDDISQAEVAFYPCGLTNDFLKVFGESEGRFHDINELINGDVIDVDYIESNHGVMLNTFSLGMDSTTVKKVEEYRLLQIFGENVPYKTAVLYALFLSKLRRYDIELDGRKLEGEVSELFFGNGNVLGGNLYIFKDTLPTDGMADFRVVFSKSGASAIPITRGFQNKTYEYVDKNSVSMRSQHIKLTRKDGKPFSVNQDGELIGAFNEWEAHIVPRGLSFVVPKGVRL